VDIVKARAKSGAKRFTLKDIEKFEIGLRILNGDDIGIKSFDSPEDIVKVRLSVSNE
jgi:hypothetical protein